MRPLRDVKDIGGDKMIGEQSLGHAEALWNEWEIHILIAVSFGLQVFLFLAAGMRRRSASSVHRVLLWLAYLSADSVAVFVLGHLAVRAGDDPRHELLLLWAPFVLVHLGGQDTITAFSMQDNELWKRHLLGFVSQTVVAGYVVSRSSWPDARLRAAMLLMFLSGCLKYAGRVVCLYLASPANLRGSSLSKLPEMLKQPWDEGWRFTKGINFRGMLGCPCLPALFIFNMGESSETIGHRFDLVSNGSMRQQWVAVVQGNDSSDIFSVDAPLNDAENISGADDVPRLLAGFKSKADRCRAYDYVGAQLVHCYEILYTKSLLLRYRFQALGDIYSANVAGLFWGFDVLDDCFSSCTPRLSFIIFPCHLILLISLLVISLLLVLLIFSHYLLAPIALVLFMVAERGGQLHTKADVTLSYILFVGAIVLDASGLLLFITSRAGIECRKQWSKMVAQYNMIKTYTKQDGAGMLSVAPQWICQRLNAFSVELLDPSITHINIPEDLKKFVLDKLLEFGTGDQQYWNFASSRGQLALERWQDTHSVSESVVTALQKSINAVDFPASVLIWHIATGLCYPIGDNTDSDKIKEQKKRSMELSNYIMYLVFKCGVMLTINSQTVHQNACDEMRCITEKEAAMEVFKRRTSEQAVISSGGGSMPTSHLQLLKAAADDLTSPVLPRAIEVAQKLIDIHKRHDGWELIAAVWLEKLFYIAPRCGGAFHYQHLATGGEFITHVLLLMRLLGPFLPPPVTLAS